MLKEEKSSSIGGVGCLGLIIIIEIIGFAFHSC